MATAVPQLSDDDLALLEGLDAPDAPPPVVSANAEFVDTAAGVQVDTMEVDASGMIFTEANVVDQEVEGDEADRDALWKAAQCKDLFVRIHTADGTIKICKSTGQVEREATDADPVPHVWLINDKEERERWPFCGISDITDTAPAPPAPVLTARQAAAAAATARMDAKSDSPSTKQTANSTTPAPKIARAMMLLLERHQDDVSIEFQQGVEVDEVCYITKVASADALIPVKVVSICEKHGTVEAAFMDGGEAGALMACYISQLRPEDITPPAPAPAPAPRVSSPSLGTIGDGVEVEDDEPEVILVDGVVAEEQNAMYLEQSMMTAKAALKKLAVGKPFTMELKSSIVMQTSIVVTRICRKTMSSMGKITKVAFSPEQSPTKFFWVNAIHVGTGAYAKLEPKKAAAPIKKAAAPRKKAPPPALNEDGSRQDGLDSEHEDADDGEWSDSAKGKASLKAAAKRVAKGTDDDSDDSDDSDDDEEDKPLSKRQSASKADLSATHKAEEERKSAAKPGPPSCVAWETDMGTRALKGDEEICEDMYEVLSRNCDAEQLAKFSRVLARASSLLKVDSSNVSAKAPAAAAAAAKPAPPKKSAAPKAAAPKAAPAKKEKKAASVDGSTKGDDDDVSEVLGERGLAITGKTLDDFQSELIKDAQTILKAEGQYALHARGSPIANSIMGGALQRVFRATCEKAENDDHCYLLSEINWGKFVTFAVKFNMPAPQRAVWNSARTRFLDGTTTFTGSKPKAEASPAPETSGSKASKGAKKRKADSDSDSDGSGSDSEEDEEEAAAKAEEAAKPKAAIHRVQAKPRGKQPRNKK